VQTAERCREAADVVEPTILMCSKHVARRHREQTPPPVVENFSEQT